MSGCRITLVPQERRAPMTEKCGQPAGPNGLCPRHEADRIRLGGTP